jgi:CHAT domain-containing protein/tetratricopeptide (TPR) repeat protein
MRKHGLIQFVCTLLLAIPGAVAARQTVSLELLPQLATKLTITPPETTTLLFRIPARQYFSIHVTDEDGDLRVSLTGPDRQLKRSITCSRDIHISEISTIAGDYRIDLSSCARQGNSEFQVLLSAPRTPAEAERLRVAAERAVHDAARFMQSRPVQLDAALRKYDEALRLWRTADDRTGEMRTLYSAGIVYRDSGKSAKAMESLSRALALAETLQEHSDRAAILRAMAGIELRTGNVVRAADYVRDALELSRSHSDTHGLADGMLVQGDVYYFTADFSKAAEAYSEAHAIWEKIHYRRGQAQALLYLATADSDRNDFSKALAEAERARSLFESAGDDLGSGRASALLGHILSSTGRKQEALDLFEEARSVLLGSADVEGQGALLNSIARVYADLGDYDSAISFSKPALQQYAALNDRVAEAITLEAIGLYYFANGDLLNARASTERALRQFQSLSNKRAEADSWLRLGVIAEAMGEFTQAMANLTRSLDMIRASADRRLEASVLLALGRIQENTGNTAAALDMYRESLRLSRNNENHSGELTALYHIAGGLRRTGDLQESLSASKAAVDVIETLRTTLASSGLRTFYMASTRQHYDLYIDSLMRTADSAAAKNAFELSERARARTLLESIGETHFAISGEVDAALGEKAAALRASIDAKSERYTQLLSRTSTPKDELSAYGDELRRLNAEYEEIQGQLRIRSPRYSTLVQPQPLRLEEIQNDVLDGDSVLLEYSLGEERSYLWTVLRDSIESHVLPPRSELERKVRRVRELIAARIAAPGEKPNQYQSRVRTAEAQFPEAAGELSRLLLGRAQDRIGSRRLIIVAEGALQYLPFAALPTPATAGTASPAPLVVEHEIVNLPSASTLAAIRRETPSRGSPDRTLAVFADPVFDPSDARVTRSVPLKTAAPKPAASLTQVLRGGDARANTLARLQSTRQEAETILAMAPDDRRMAALGFNATKDAVLNSDLSRYRIVHFATHALLNDGHPDLSSLVLSLVNQNGNPQSGFLRLRDIYNLRLSAELVVLSACDTALGKEIKGEGLMSMVRGFMYSGTPRVLASLWAVDDDATAELMKEFYKHVLQDGLSPAAALRQAQITQLQKRSKQSPYFWAGFQLAGEWK